jgi:hypothetical protein
MTWTIRIVKIRSPTRHRYFSAAMMVICSFPSWISETTGLPFLKFFRARQSDFCRIAGQDHGSIETISETVHQKQMFIFFRFDEMLSAPRNRGRNLPKIETPREIS